jgi:glycosyltransferase involved in cell wall biosynthesis
MKISIIIPNLNDAKGLENTLLSIIKQEYTNYECIVVDGNSSDHSKKVIKKYSNYITSWISENDSGIYDAINKGLGLSNGDIINTINSGDVYFSKKSLQIIINYFKKDGDLDFVFGAVKKNKIYYKYEPSKMNWTFNFYPSHSGGFFVKKYVHNKIGKYHLEFPCSSDYDFFWRMIKTYKYRGKSTKKNEIISIFKPGGFSSQYGVYNHIWEETKIRLKNKQNFVIVYLIYFLRLIKNFNKFF